MIEKQRVRVVRSRHRTAFVKGRLVRYGGQLWRMEWLGGEDYAGQSLVSLVQASWIDRVMDRLGLVHAREW